MAEENRPHCEALRHSAHNQKQCAQRPSKTDNRAGLISTGFKIYHSLQLTQVGCQILLACKRHGSRDGRSTAWTTHDNTTAWESCPCGHCALIVSSDVIGHPVLGLDKLSIDKEINFPYGSRSFTQNGETYWIVVGTYVGTVLQLRSASTVTGRYDIERGGKKGIHLWFGGDSWGGYREGNKDENGEKDISLQMHSDSL